MNRLLLHLGPVLTLCGALSAQPIAPDAEQAHAMLRFIPAQTQAALVVPNLKRLSDQITQCLEGMDRANILMGSRPLDQMKATAGMNVGVNDLGGLVIILAQNVNDALDQRPLIIVPVSDAQVFLEGNFPLRDGDVYKNASGKPMYAKSLGTHVVVSGDAAAVGEFQENQASETELIKNALGERGLALASGVGDLFVIGRGHAVHRVFQTAQARAGGGIVPDAVFPAEWANEFEIGVLTFDFDPLGLMVRWLGRFARDSDFAKFSQVATGGGANLARLPNKPLLFAAAVDLSALANDALVQRLLNDIGIDRHPPWLSQVQSAQWSAHPSPAGLSGGLLNDAVLVLRSSDPRSLKKSLREWISTAASQMKWETDRPVKDAGVADAYEIRVADADAKPFAVRMAEQAMFRSGARRGFIAANADSVLITFSQRPAVLAAALQASNAATQSPIGKESLESSAAIRMMRQWMPPHRFFECYIGWGRLSEIARQALAAAGRPTHVLPEIDPATPPIGVAISAGNGGLEGSVVIPSAALAVLFDQAMKAAAAQHSEEESPHDE